jgi:hypothetical protein
LFFFVGGIAFLPGWHHIVAAQTGRLLDESWRADDVSMKTTRWQREHHRLATTGVHFIGFGPNRARAASGEQALRSVRQKKGFRCR